MFYGHNIRIFIINADDLQDYYLLLFLHFADFSIGKFVADLDISAFHAGGTDSMIPARSQICAAR